MLGLKSEAVVLKVYAGLRLNSFFLSLESVWEGEVRAEGISQNGLTVFPFFDESITNSYNSKTQTHKIDMNLLLKLLRPLGKIIGLTQ